MVIRPYTTQRSEFIFGSAARQVKRIQRALNHISNCRFIFKNNGVLFENDLIQIGVKSEYRQNLGRLGLFYGNKTQTVLQVRETIEIEIENL